MRKKGSMTLSNNYYKSIIVFLTIYVSLIFVSTMGFLIFIKGGFSCGWIVDNVGCTPFEAIKENVLAWGGVYLIILGPIILLYYLYQRRIHQ